MRVRTSFAVIAMCMVLSTSMVASAQNNPPMPSSVIQEKKLESELEEANKEIERLSSELETVQAERDKFKSKCRSYRKKYEKESSRVKELEAEIRSLRQSSSSSASVPSNNGSASTSDGSSEKTKVVSNPGKTLKIDESDLIRISIDSHVSSEYDKTSVDRITINDDYGKGSGYIALVYLTWNVQNRAETTKKMLRMYSDDLAATIAKEYSSVNEIAIFWTVPYLTNNTSKWAYSCEGGGAYCTDIVTAF